MERESVGSQNLAASLHHMSEFGHRILREFAPDDTEAVRQILTESNLSVSLPSNLERPSYSPLGQIFSWVCEQDGKVVAVLQWRDLGEELEILDLAVARKHRRTGAASFLLQNFLRQEARTGVNQVLLEVRESNSAAIALYHKFGFSTVGRRPDYYRSPVEAAVLMKLSIQP